MSDSTLQSLLDRDAIRDVLSRYCRGLDRMDRPLADTVWHPEGTALYEGIFEGTGAGFLDWVWEAHANMDRHSHQITNVLIELDGDRATSEAYVSRRRPQAAGARRSRSLPGSMGAASWRVGNRSPTPFARHVERLPTGACGRELRQSAGSEGSFLRVFFGIAAAGRHRTTQQTGYFTSIRTGNFSR